MKTWAMKAWLLPTLGALALTVPALTVPALAQAPYPDRYGDPRYPGRAYPERVAPERVVPERGYPERGYSERDRWSRDRPVQDGLTEMQREMRRQGEPSVPLQNRESRIGDELASQIEGARGWLMEAQRALRRGQLGLANEFLERAETRLLTRSTEPALAREPLQNSMTSHIAGARQALWRRDRRETERQIEMALQAAS